VELGLRQFVECPLLQCHFVLGRHHSKLREWVPMDGHFGLWWSRVFLFLLFLWCGFICWYLCKGTRLLKSSTLGIGVWTCILQFLANGNHAIGFRSALQGGQQYMEGLQVMCEAKLSTIILLVGLRIMFIFVWNWLSTLFGVEEKCFNLWILN
jgi:hypothetical protein